jgi:hypothetical protein
MSVPAVRVEPRSAAAAWSRAEHPRAVTTAQRGRKLVGHPEASPASERQGVDNSAPSDEQESRPAGAEGDKRDRETDGIRKEQS